MTIDFRPMTDDDLPFLARVYISTRWEELQATGWSDDTKIAFLQQQFALQHEYYTANYDGADFLIILHDDQPAGRLYVVEWKDTIRVIDIALLPAFRNRGIGTQVMTDIIRRAEKSGLSVSIHVEHNNPALSLYRRLGFEKHDEHGIYWLMIRETT